MPKFCTYTTNSNPEPVALTPEEYEDQGLPDDWADFIWQKAESKEVAVSMHEQRLDEFMAAESGMTLEDYIQNG